MISETLQAVLPRQETPLLVAVSGGVDSVVLLHGLHALGYRITAAHFDHKLREASADDVKFVEKFCQKLAVPLRLGQGEVREVAESKRLSLEDAARQLRYQFLFKEAAGLNLKAVVTGHHADDQVETILMNLLRGAGPAGLSGMSSTWLPNPWNEEIALVRPFLSIWKTEILAYAKQQVLPFIEDLSNKDQSFLRNRIRHELIPLLKEYNPRFASHLVQTGTILRAEDEFLQHLTDQAAEKCFSFRDQRSVVLDRDLFLLEPLAVRRRLIRYIYQHLRPMDPEISYQHVQQALLFITDQPAAREENWLGKLNLISSQDRIMIAEWGYQMEEGDQPQLLHGSSIEIVPEKETLLGGGWYFLLKPHIRDEGGIQDLYSKQTTRSYQVLITAESLQGDLVLRTRKPGDRVRPLGMGGKSLKVSDLMINEKIPVRLRKRWPLLVSGEEIIWVPGLRLGEKAKVKAGAEGLIEVRVYQKDP